MDGNKSWKLTQNAKSKSLPPTPLFHLFVLASNHSN